MSRPQARARRRGGYALLSFALLVMPLLAIAALVIDLGLAGATQLRMQGAADFAALAGPRGWRGVPAAASWCQGEVGACSPAARSTAWDAARRDRVVRRAGAAFASSGAGDPVAAIRLPAVTPIARPGITDTSLVTQLAASGQRFATAPVLARNAGTTPDQPAGDIVAGRSTARGAGRVVSCRGGAHLAPFDENCRYERSDFQPSTVAAGHHRAVVVRLRLSGETALPGVSTPQAPVPALFARLIENGGGSPNAALRSRGIWVRATAIGDARPALSVGAPIGTASGTLPGGANFALDEAVWRSAPLGTAQPLALLSDGALFLGGSLSPAGRVIGSTAAAASVGAVVPAALAGTQVQVPGGEGFVPLYRAIAAATGELRVVGFGRIRLTPATSTGIPGTAEPQQLRKLPAMVAEQNVSAIAAPGLRGLGDTVVAEIFRSYREGRDCLPTTAAALVCAAVLVR